VKNGDYVLVFLDLLLPGMNGAELFGKIRAIKPDLPVIVITGYTESELMMKALKLWSVGCDEKTF